MAELPFYPDKSISPHGIIASGLCIGCGSCAANSNGRAHMDLDAFGHFKPVGDSKWLHEESGAFARTCPFSPRARNEDQIAADLFPNAPHRDPKIGSFEAAYVGYVAEEDFRARGSSGGMVTWVAAELLRRGLVDGVAHVVAVPDPQRDKRFFRYRIARSETEVREGAKSRYYPVELSDVLEQIRATPGRYAVVGVPCFIKALNLLRREDPIIRERVAYTLGLFCGHMKSARLVEGFAWQMGVSIEEVQRVEFRLKDPSRPASWYTAHLTLRDGRVLQKDWWNLADGDWGAGFFQNSACNFCDDVVAETADVAFGDAWVEPYSSDGRGTNVVVVRSPEVAQIMSEAIDAGRLQLEEVDHAFIEQTQAAGFRQRREGLAYRLTWAPPGGLEDSPTQARFPQQSPSSAAQANLYFARLHHCGQQQHFLAGEAFASSSDIHSLGTNGSGDLSRPRLRAERFAGPHRLGTEEKMTTFLLIRHAVHVLGGETIAGRTPGVHLSPQGQSDAQALAERVAGLPVKALYCSPMDRTQQTAAPLAKRWNLPAQICPEIQELNYGDWTGKTLKELRPIEEWKQWNSFRSGARIPGGETMLEVQARMIAKMQELCENHPNECVALVSHGDVIKAAVAYCMGVPLDLFSRIEISPASVSVVAIAPYGPWSLCINHTGGLENLPTLGG